MCTADFLLYKLKGHEPKRFACTVCNFILTNLHCYVLTNLVCPFWNLINIQVWRTNSEECITLRRCNSA